MQLKIALPSHHDKADVSSLSFSRSHCSLAAFCHVVTITGWHAIGQIKVTCRFFRPIAVRCISSDQVYFFIQSLTCKTALFSIELLSLVKQSVLLCHWSNESQTSGGRLITTVGLFLASHPVSCKRSFDFHQFPYQANVTYTNTILPLWSISFCASVSNENKEKFCIIIRNFLCSSPPIILYFLPA